MESHIINQPANPDFISWVRRLQSQAPTDRRSPYAMTKTFTAPLIQSIYLYDEN